MSTGNGTGDVQAGRHPYRLADLTWPEIHALLPSARVAIIPLGACEQHGLGLALRTDTTRAEVVADRIAEQLGGLALVTPVIPVGVSEHHMAFSGTLTVSPATLIQIIHDLVDSLHRHGVRRVFILTGHGGNNSTVDVAVAELRREYPDVLLAWSGLTPVVPDLVTELSASSLRGHSCEMETSQAWDVDPTLVREDRLARGSAELADLDGAGRLSRSATGIHFPQRYDLLSRTGGLGDPRNASPQIGERLVSTIVDRVCAFLRAFAELDPL